jgi:hypothetical protein
MVVGWMKVRNGPNKSYQLLVIGKCIIEFKIKGQKRTIVLSLCAYHKNNKEEEEVLLLHQ